MQLTAPTTAGTVTRSGDATLDLTFQTPGVASSAQSGTGSKYLTFAAARSCTGGSLTGTWSSKAGKGKASHVKKATFYVNDVKVKSVRKPSKKDVTTLAGLTPGAAADVLVKIKLAKKGAGTVETERSYLRCS